MLESAFCFSSNAVIAAEQRIGELLLEIPKAQGRRTDKETSVERSTKVETKNQTIERMGYGTTEAKDYQQLPGAAGMKKPPGGGL